MLSKSNKWLIAATSIGVLYALALLVFVGYKNPLIGAVICLVTGLIYIISGWSNMHWTAHVVIAGPLSVLSMLYIMAYKSIK